MADMINEMREGAAAPPRRLPEPMDAQIMCQCEHISHEQSAATAHPYLGVPAGTRRADYVGRVCDECAKGHLAEYLISDRGVPQ